jgi:hypothetical protein
MSFLTRALCFPSRVTGKPATRLGLLGPTQKNILLKIKILQKLFKGSIIFRNFITAF